MHVLKKLHTEFRFRQYIREQFWCTRFLRCPRAQNLVMDPTVCVFLPWNRLVLVVEECVRGPHVFTAANF